MARMPSQAGPMHSRHGDDDLNQGHLAKVRERDEEDHHHGSFESDLKSFSVLILDHVLVKFPHLWLFPRQKSLEGLLPTDAPCRLPLSRLPRPA